MTVNPTESEQTRILARVRKMMNLANNVGATTGERDNALRMAHATLAKYNLEMVSEETVAGRPVAGEEPREQQQETFLGYPWARHVANSAATLFFCKYYFSMVRGTGTAMHNFIGRHSNAIMAREMARYLVKSIHAEARAYQRANYPHLQTQYTSFANGAMLKVYSRCQALRSESEAAPPVMVHTGSVERSMSLAVIYRDEDTANDQYIALTVGKMRHAKKNDTKIRDAKARWAGDAYGAKVSLNRQIQ